MSEKLDIIKRLFNSGFNESKEWSDWYFTKVAKDENAMLSYASSIPISCLMLDQYKLKLGEIVTEMGYISCATTLRSARHQGHMGRLLNDAIMESQTRGDTIVSLIPATNELYFYYDKFSFATVFYITEERYTSLHQFEFNNSFGVIEPDFAFFHDLEIMRESTVVHSQEDFDNILTDIAFDSGCVITVVDRYDNQNKSMLFAIVEDEIAKVKEILSSTDEARETALSVLRDKIGERMIIVDSQPSDNPTMLCSRGMARIVNVEKLLSQIAQADNSIEQTIRVRDGLLTDNDAVFIIHNGQVERQSSTMRQITLDVSIDTLARIIFNSKRIGSIFNLPSFRPSIFLMLD